jgi:ABC-type antimicrobial peptide transport system permease subunit
VRTVEELRDRSLAGAELRTALLAAFAGLALLLAMMGTYGVMSVVVAQRTREMGIRIALGASPSSVVRLIVAEGLRPLLAGTAAGLAGGFVVSRAVAGLLFEVTPGDPAAFVMASIVVAAAGALAAWLPARRACRVDPVIALRPE